MGVSFKISRTGTRFKPKPVISDLITLNGEDENSPEISRIPAKHEANGKDEDPVDPSGSFISSRTHHNSAEEVSFLLNLYPDGYSIGKPSENDNGLLADFQGSSKLLHQYDRNSEGLFSAIESGRLPGGILDDIPCKYVGGALICEVRDYRKCIPGSESNIGSVNGSATITRVRLEMSFKNVVMDIPLMADDSWTYGDLMEVESRILKAVQPKLCLDPTPRLDRLCERQVSTKLNLGLFGKRKRRLRQMPEVTVTSNNRPHGKKICIDRAPERSSYRIGELRSSSCDMIIQLVQDNVAAPTDMLSKRPRNFVQDESIAALNSTSQLSEFEAGPVNQRNVHDLMQGSGDVLGVPRAGQEIPVSCAENMNSAARGKMESKEGSTLMKRAGLDGIQQKQIGVDGLQGPDLQWRNQLVQHQPNANANLGMEKYPQLVGEGVAKRDIIKEKADADLIETEMRMMEAQGSHMDLRQRFQHNSFMRPAFQQANEANLTQQVEKHLRKEAQFTAKRRSKSRSQTPAIVASPASVSNVGGPVNASSPSISTPQPADQSMTERFAKIELVAKRHQLNCEKNKVDEIVRTPQVFSPQELLVCLSNATHSEYGKHETCTRSLSQSLVGGSMNVCKIRVINMQPEQTVQGNMIHVSSGVRTRMVMSEKPNDGSVAMHYGDLGDEDYLNAEDHLPTLPNTASFHRLSFRWVAS